MSSFVAAHWWTWPIVYAGIGALLAGLFGATDSTKQWLTCVALWPVVFMTFIGALLRNLL